MDSFDELMCEIEDTCRTVDPMSVDRLVTGLMMDGYSHAAIAEELAIMRAEHGG